MNGARSKQHRAALRVFEAETKQTATMEDMGWRCTRRSRPEQLPRVYRLVGQPDKRTASVTWTAPDKWWLQWWQHGGWIRK